MKSEAQPPPAFLNAEGKRIWRETIAQMAAHSIHDPADAVTPETYVLAVLHQRAIADELRNAPLLTEDGKISPLWRAAEAVAGTVLEEIRNQRPNGASAKEIASWAGGHQGNPFWVAIEAASTKAIKVMSPTVLTWRLKALVDAPTAVGNEVLVLRYVPDHNNPRFIVRSA
jgi:hypothetical protein